MPVLENEFTPTELSEFRRMLEIQRIQDVMSRYVRGIDRGDAELLRSTMWEGAQDDHGTYVGDRDGFIEYRMGVGIKTKTSMSVSSNYHLTAPVHVLEMDDTTAKVETYFHFVLTANQDGLEILQHNSGRYLDVFEKRDAEWRILRRKVLYDWCSADTHTPGWAFAKISPDNRGEWHMTDASYKQQW